MPCRDGRDDDNYQATQVAEARTRKIEAMLCAVLSTLDRTGNLATALAATNWKEAGISESELITWWHRHRAADARRIAQEQAARDAQAKRNLALAKLTEEERKLLGVK